MKNLMILTLLACFSFGSFAQASDTWLGKIEVQNNRRGNFTKFEFTSQTIMDNLADYNDFYISFDFYKRGVTDGQATEIWKNIDARVELVKDSTGEVIKSGPLNIIGTRGHNAVYQLALRDISPDTVAGYDAEMRNRQFMHTHLRLIFDGIQMAAIPIAYSYAP